MLASTRSIACLIVRPSCNSASSKFFNASSWFRSVKRFVENLNNGFRAWRDKLKRVSIIFTELYENSLTYYSRNRPQLSLMKLKAIVCPHTSPFDTEEKTLKTSCFLICPFSLIARSRYRDNIHCSLLQPKACIRVSFSLAMVVFKNRSQAKSHSKLSPCLIAVQ